jgi:diacylglycerol kinase (ATP)
LGVGRWEWQIGYRNLGVEHVRGRLIVNPISGADRAVEFLPLVNARLGRLVRDLDITIATGRDAAVRAAARTAADGCDALYVAGGDGTLNAVLHGLAAHGDAFPRIPIGVIPFGTGNDFARTLGLGTDPEAALDMLLDALVIDVDLGMLNDRPFINVSAGGFVADVSETVTEGLKDSTGRLAYVIAGARALLGTEPFAARFTVDGTAVAAEAWAGTVELQMFAICNARTIGGGRPIAPEALLDDGLLDVVLVRRMPTLEFLGVLQRIAMGEHIGDERILHFRGSTFDLQLDRPVRVNADGEVHEAERCRYTVVPRAARFFCGREPHAIGQPVPFSR